MIPSFTQMPQAMAEKYSDDGGEPPKFQRTLEEAFRYRMLRKKISLTIAFTIGLAIAQWLPLIVWAAALAVSVVTALTFWALSFKSYLKQLESASELNRGMRMVDPLPDDHPDVTFIDPSDTTKKNGVPIQAG